MPNLIKLTFASFLALVIGSAFARASQSGEIESDLSLHLGGDPGGRLEASSVLGTAAGIQARRGRRGGQGSRPQRPVTPPKMSPGILKPPLFVTCSPGSVKFGQDQPVKARNPVVTALEQCGPGSIITLKKGNYPSFAIGFAKEVHWNARSSGGTPTKPITIQGEPGAIIRANGDSGDSITIHQEITTGHFIFRNLTIEPGYRAAVMFYKQPPGKFHEGFQFLDCDIIGSWDHVKKKGKKSKWGVWGHSLKDFTFQGLTRMAEVRDIQQEHAFYLQNNAGDIRIENVQAARLGRTFCQFTARERDGAAGVGTITIRGCKVEDIGLSVWDGYKGGTAFTLAGRIEGPIIFERNSYRAGFDPAIARLTQKSQDYGTAALVCWDGGGKVHNGTVILRDNDFEMAPGCGDRPLVSIGGCREVQILGANRFISGGKMDALSLDPVGDRRPGGVPTNVPNGEVTISAATTFKGAVKVRGIEVDPQTLMSEVNSSSPNPTDSQGDRSRRNW